MLLEKKQLEKIKTLIHDYSGILLERVSSRRIDEKILSQMKKHNISRIDDYCSMLAANTISNSIMDDLLAELTVNESYYFRNPGQFDYIIEQFLPSLFESRGVKNPVRIWSAGCARGEETYSIAMVAQYFIDKVPGCSFFINAGDINSKNLVFARKGEYSKRSLRNHIDRYEKMLGIRLGNRDDKGSCCVDSRLQSLVNFKKLNLKKIQNLKSFAGSDIIFCRNVLIYFDEQFRIELVNEFLKYLSPGGLLLLGESECIPKQCSGFELISYKGSYAYRKE